MTPAECLVECEKAVLILVANVTDIVNGGEGDTGSFHEIEQPTAGLVIAGALAIIRTLAEEGHRDRIQQIVRDISLATQVAVTQGRTS